MPPTDDSVTALSQCEAQELALYREYDLTALELHAGSRSANEATAGATVEFVEGGAWVAILVYVSKGALTSSRMGASETGPNRAWPESCPPCE